MSDSESDIDDNHNKRSIERDHRRKESLSNNENSLGPPEQIHITGSPSLGTVRYFYVLIQYCKYNYNRLTTYLIVIMITIYREKLYRVTKIHQLCQMTLMKVK